MPDHIFNLTFLIGEKQTNSMKIPVRNEKKHVKMKQEDDYDDDEDQQDDKEDM